jgi:hypothetical protein
MDVLETTYVSKTNQTNQPTSPTPPDEYLSARITASHDTWNAIAQAGRFNESWYISWAEHGKSGTNPHFHVLLPGTGTNDAERVRKRLKTAGYTGNSQLSVKFNKNGILQGIQYCGKEGSPFKIGGDQTVIQSWIDAAPKWESRDKNIGAYLEKKSVKRCHEDHFYDINYRNLIKVSLRYRKQHGMKTKDLAEVLAQMCLHGWAFCKQMQKEGIPETFFGDFEAQCDGKSLFTAGMINNMRRPVDWRASGI